MPRRLSCFVAVLFAAACSWTWRSFSAVQKSCVLAVKTKPPAAGGQRSPAEVLLHGAALQPKARCKQSVEHVELFFVRQGVYEKATVHGKQMVDILAGDLLSAADGDAAAPPGAAAAAAAPAAATPAPLLMKRMFLLQKVGQTYEYASNGRNKGSRYLWRAVVLRGAVGGEGQRQVGAAPGPGASTSACSYTVTLWFLTSVHTAHDAYESALNARVPEADWRKKIQADELETEIKDAIAKGRRGGLWTGVEDDDLDLGPHRRDPFVLATLAAMAGCRGGGAMHDQMLTKMGDRDFRSRLVQGARVRDAIAQAVGLRGHTSLPLLLRGRRETNEQSFELAAKRFMTMVNASGAPAGAPQSVLDPFFERQRMWFQRQGFRNRFGILASGKMVEADGTFADTVKAHKLVFLTGLAGTGKSTELLWQTLANWKKVFVIARQKGLQTELRRQVAAQDVTAGSTCAGELAKRISFDAIDPVASKSESESHRMEKPYFQERQDDFLRILSKKKMLHESCSVEKRRSTSSDGTTPKGKGGKARGKAVAQGVQKTSRALVYEWYEEEWGSPATYDVFRFFAAICQKFWVGRAGEEDGDYEDHLARPLPADDCRQRLLDMANRSTNHFLPQLRESTARAMGYEDENQAKAELRKDGGPPAPSTADLLSPWVDCFLAFRTEMPQILLEVARKQAQAGTSTGLERERFRSLQDRTLAGFTNEQLTTWAAAHGLALDAPMASGEPEEGAWGGQRQHHWDESDDEVAGPTETLLVVDEAQNLSDMELLFYLALAARIEGLRLVFGIDIHQQLATGPRDKIALLTALLSSSMGLRTLPRETRAALDVDIGVPAVHRLTTVWRTPERLLPLVEKLVLWRAKLVGLSLSTCSGRGARAAGAGGLADGDGLGGRDATSSPLLAAPPAEDEVEEGSTSEDDKHKSGAPPLRRRGSLAIVRATSFSDDHVADAIYQQSGGKIEKSTLAKTLLPNVVKIVVGSRKELEARRDLSSTVLSVAEVQGLEFGVVLIFLPHQVEQQLQLQKGEKTSSQYAGTSRSRAKRATKQQLGDWLAQLFIAFTRANSGIIVVGQNASTSSQQTPVFSGAGKLKHQHQSASTPKILLGEPFSELLHGAVWPSPFSPIDEGERGRAAGSATAPPVLHILTEAQEKWESTLFTLLQGAGSPGTSALARELFRKHVLPRWKTSAAWMRTFRGGSASFDDTAMEVEDSGDTVMEGADEEGPRPSQTAEAHQLTWGVDRVSGKRVTLDGVGLAAARFYSRSRHRAASRSNSMEVDVEDIGEEGVEENGAWVAFQLAVAAYEEKNSQAFHAKLPRDYRTDSFRSMPSYFQTGVLQGFILQEVEHFLRANDIEAVFSVNGGRGRGVPVPNVPQIRGVFSLDELARLAKVAQRSSLEDLGPQEGRGHDGADEDKDSPLEDFGAVAYVLVNLDQFARDAAFPKFRHHSYAPPPPAAGAAREAKAAIATKSGSGSGGLPLRLECLHDTHAVFESLGRRLLHLHLDVIIGPVAGSHFSAARESKPLLQLSHQVRAIFGREYLLPTVLSLPVDGQLLQQLAGVDRKMAFGAADDELEQLESCERSWAQVVAAAGEPWDRFGNAPGDSDYLPGLLNTFPLAAVMAKVKLFRATRANRLAEQEVASYCENEKPGSTCALLTRQEEQRKMKREDVDEAKRKKRDAQEEEGRHKDKQNPPAKEASTDEQKSKATKSSSAAPIFGMPRGFLERQHKKPKEGRDPRRQSSSAGGPASASALASAVLRFYTEGTGLPELKRKAVRYAFCDRNANARAEVEDGRCVLTLQRNARALLNALFKTGDHFWFIFAPGADAEHEHGPAIIRLGQTAGHTVWAQMKIAHGNFELEEGCPQGEGRAGLAGGSSPQQAHQAGVQEQRLDVPLDAVGFVAEAAERFSYFLLLAEPKKRYWDGVKQLLAQAVLSRWPGYLDVASNVSASPVNALPAAPLVLFAGAAAEGGFPLYVLSRQTSQRSDWELPTMVANFRSESRRAREALAEWVRRHDGDAAGPGAFSSGTEFQHDRRLSKSMGIWAEMGMDWALPADEGATVRRGSDTMRAKYLTRFTELTLSQQVRQKNDASSRSAGREGPPEAGERMGLVFLGAAGRALDEEMKRAGLNYRRDELYQGAGAARASTAAESFDKMLRLPPEEPFSRYKVEVKQADGDGNELEHDLLTPLRVLRRPAFYAPRGFLVGAMEAQWEARQGTRGEQLLLQKMFEDAGGDVDEDVDEKRKMDNMDMLTRSFWAGPGPAPTARRQHTLHRSDDGRGADFLVIHAPAASSLGASTAHLGAELPRPHHRAAFLAGVWQLLADGGIAVIAAYATDSARERDAALTPGPRAAVGGQKQVDTRLRQHVNELLKTASEQTTINWPTEAGKEEVKVSVSFSNAYVQEVVSGDEDDAKVFLLVLQK